MAGAIASAAGLGSRKVGRLAASSERSAGFSSIGTLVGSGVGAAAGALAGAGDAGRIACGLGKTEVVGLDEPLWRSVLSE